MLEVISSQRFGKHGGDELNVIKIQPNVKKSKDMPKQRVAAYCRVSTDNSGQIESLETQIKHYETYIKSNPSWVYAGIYYDEGISGTKKEKRHGLLRMVSDCENKKIDLIVTKSISRFARNTAYCLELVRKLLNIGVFVYFENENINTGSMESELMLSILSGLAEGESVSISKNNKWALKRRFQNGLFKISYAPYGYDVLDGKLVVNESQAEIVRFIFSEILSGKGAQKIAKGLNDRMIPTKRNSKWTSKTIIDMVRNEKYVGDALFQKYYTDDNFNRRRNKGECNQYFATNHHDPIVSRETFEAAQAVIDQHCKEYGLEKNNSKYQNRYPFSGKIICGQCGGVFKRRTHATGRHRIAWCCSTHIMDIEKCSMKYVPQADIEFAFVTMMNKLIFGHEAVLRPLFNALRGMNSENAIEAIKAIDKSLEENALQRNVLVELMAKGYLEPAIYNKSNNDLLQEAERLRRQKKSITQLLSSDFQAATEAGTLLQYAAKTSTLSAFDGALFTRFVARVVVLSREEIAFELKCSLTLKERLAR